MERRIPYPETDDGGAAAVRSWWSENGWSLAQQATRITTKTTTTRQDKNNNYRADVSDRLEMFIHVKTALMYVGRGLRVDFQRRDYQL